MYPGYPMVKTTNILKLPCGQTSGVARQFGTLGQGMNLTPLTKYSADRGGVLK